MSKRLAALGRYDDECDGMMRRGMVLLIAGVSGEAVPAIEPRRLDGDRPWRR